MKQHDRGSRASWLLLALTVVLVCVATLWPFRVVAPVDFALATRTLLLGWGVSTDLDVLRNALLFMPFGYAAARLCARHRPASNILAGVCTLAIALAYSVEVVQTFMPSRFSSLVDVIANTVGAGVGAAACLLGRPQRARLRAPAYALLMCAAAVPLNRSALLENWNAYPLLFGNEASGHRPWNGRIHEACFADRALDLQARSAAVPDALCASLPRAAVIGWYGGSHDAATSDRTKTLPNVEWRGREDDARKLGVGPAESLGPGGWLSSEAAGSVLSSRITRTGAFSVVVVFDSNIAVQQGPARIVSLSIDPDRRNFTLGQDGTDVIVRLRTPITGLNGTARQLRVPAALSAPGPHWAAFTYDGATQCLTVNGRRSCMSLTPGVAMAATLDRQLAQRGAPRWWDAAYYAVMFVPLGMLLHVRGADRQSHATRVMALIACAVALEAVSAWVPDRAIRWDAVAQAVAWGSAGYLLPRLASRLTTSGPVPAEP